MAQCIARARARVWDPWVRLLHGLLAFSVLAAFGIGVLAPEWWLDRHALLGAVAGLALGLRVIWGIAGGGAARFAAFPLSPRAALAQGRQALRGHAEPAYGHPPAGAWSALILLALAFLAVVTGVAAYGSQEGLGLLAGLLPARFGDALAEGHELVAWTLLAFILVHLLGVAVESVLLRETLPLSMVTGRRRRVPPPPDAARHPARPALAIGLSAGLLLFWAAAVVFPSGDEAAHDPPSWIEGVYQQECSDCHLAYPPLLLPAASWERLMATLDDHFGEPAGLAPETTARIRALLRQNAAEYTETEAGIGFRIADPTAPLRITASPYWRARHAALSSAVFDHPSVRSKGNCAACHSDAAPGTFRDSRIHLPSPQETSP